MDLIGGAEGNRTLDLLNAIQALSQLSYGPTRRKRLDSLRVREREKKVKPRVV
jgi:hypothetical protein